MFGRSVTAFLFGLLLVASLAACRSETVEVSPAAQVEQIPAAVETIVEEGQAAEVTRQATTEIGATGEAPKTSDEELVTLNLAFETDIPILDPQVWAEAYLYVENVFVQLTKWDPATEKIAPEAATSWEISEDGLLYTFHLRDDIPWVYHDPVSGETTQVLDGAGRPRFVTAEDFAYGIRRACHPTTASYPSSIVGPVIAGCDELLHNEDPENEQALVDAIGVRAPGPQTLSIELKYPAGYFINMTTFPTLSAIPSWAVEEHGDADWAKAGNIVSNGPYVLHEWVSGVRLTLLRNPLMPDDMQGEGNVDRVVSRVVDDVQTNYYLWLNGEVDISYVPDAEVESHLQQYPGQTYQESDRGVVYIGFVNTKPPFDDARLRRAFGAAIDRETLVSAVSPGQARPMIHFAPPGNFGAPPIDEVGVGFDPEYAREQLAAAGYPGCEGLPTVSLLSLSDTELPEISEFLQGQWELHLGCPAQTIQIQRLGPSEFSASIDAGLPVEQAPHIFTGGWIADYPDENNWVGDVLRCGNEGDFTRRTCSHVDDLIVEAAQEGDPDRRIELYRQIEEAFFGAEGEMPIAPLYLRSPSVAIHNWLDRAGPTTTNQLFNWRIDWEAKQAARQ